MIVKEQQEIILKGIGASPGICIGKAYLVDRGTVDVVKKYIIRKEDLEKEKNRFKASVQRAKEELHQIIEKTPEEYREHANILETHVVLLKDKMLYGKTIETIERERVNAEWALRKVVARLKDIFRDMSDPYFRERGSDIVHVSNRIMRNLSGADHVSIKDIDKRVILVAEDLSPADTSQIQLERVKGFVTDAGGMASHTGIIARTLQIPAVLGADRATKTIRNDDLLVVDGTNGLLIIHPSESTLIEYEERRARHEIRIASITRGADAPAVTTDGVRVEVMGNIELPEEVVAVRDFGGDGIGLYRSEFQYLSRTTFPSEDDLFDKYKDVVEVMAPRPVVIRTLDINGDKAVSYLSGADEANPALGLRAIRYCLQKPEVFKVQLRAILRAAAFGNVRILIPMISDFEEVVQVKRLLDESAIELERRGVPCRREIQMGIMVEVPSAVVMIDTIAKKVDFFSIGTNDLVQYAMAIDRQNRQVAHLFNPLHPALIRMVKHVSDVARDEGVRLAMCGEMAAYPLHIPVLLGLCIDELSMNPQSIPLVKRAVRTLSASDTRGFMDSLLKQVRASDVNALLREAYEEHMTRHVHTE